MSNIPRLPGAASLLLGMVLVSGCTLGWSRDGGDMPEMHKSFSKTVDIQTAVVEGDLERAKKAASWIVTREQREVYPPEVQAYQREMLGYAALIAKAPDLETVSAQTGHLAAACGSCHQATEAGLRFRIGSSALRGTGRVAQMIRHLWAADRMWEGLVGPSEEAWTAGARVLAETEPALARAVRASTTSSGQNGSVGQHRGVAAEALQATDRDERARVYSRMLNGCNGCHSSIGVQVQM